MRILTATLLLGVALSACLQDGTSPAPPVEPLGVEAHPPVASEYAFVWVRGERVWEHVGGEEGARAVCTVAWDHDVDAERRRITHGDRHAFRDPGTLVAFDVWDQRTSCPVAYTLTDEPDASREIGGHRLSLRVAADGTVTVDGHDVPLGHKAVWTRLDKEHEGGATYRTTLTVDVENRGGWPQGGLVAA